MIRRASPSLRRFCAASLRGLAVALLGAVCVSALPASARGKSIARFALVIGNNRSLDARRPGLRYADDDAVATHQLLTDAGVESTLLVMLDADTREVHPHLRAEPPDAATLERSVGALATKVAAAAAGGRSVEFLLFYSGHGEVDGGEGYVLLADQRLTRSGLSALLTRIGAQRNHVVIDACKSYFLVFDRGPGGSRARHTAPLPRSVPAEIPNTGFVLSTSSDRESHEWERYQAGIVSHELRSALRGGADVDADGRITYAEIGAFLSKANERIIARFRPDVLVRPPGNGLEEAVLQWTSEPSVELPDFPWGHVYVESARGERLMDLHRVGGRSASLWLPSERPLFVRSQDERVEYVIDRPEAIRLDPARGRAPTLASRGALHLAFEQLFASPLDSHDVVRFGRGDGRTVPSPHEVAASAEALGPGGLLPMQRRESLRDDARCRLCAYVTAAAGAVLAGAGTALLLRSLALKRQSDQAELRARATNAPDLRQRALERYAAAESRHKAAWIVGGVGIAGMLAGLYASFALAPER